MPRVTLSQTNFTAGEISPRLHGRTDIARYQNGAEEMRDMLPQVYGGAKRRPGSLFVASTKHTAKRSRLVPFIKDNDTAYMLEFGDLYVRVFKDGAAVMDGGVPYEIVSPYTIAQVLQMDYTQSADIMFLFHENVAPQRLVCTGDTSWALDAVPFIETPFEEPGSYPGATLTPSAKDPVGTSISLTLSTAVLSAADIGKFIKVNGGLVKITNYAASTPSGSDTHSGDGSTTIFPYTFSVTSASEVVVTVGGTTLTMGVDYSVHTATLDQNVYFVTAPAAGVDNIVISKVTTAATITATIKQELSSTVGAPPDAWSLHAPAWSASRGYPKSGTLYEQRLVCGGSPTFPQTIWGSVTGAYLDFTAGTNDDDAFSFTIASDITNPIEYLASNRALLAFTSGGEFTIVGGTEKPLAPTNAQIKPRTNYGCARVRPVRIRDAELFVQRAGRKVRSFGYNLANDNWEGPDLSLLAEHLTEGNISDICWQQEPDSIVWLARGDGALLSITLDKEQDVTGWAWHEEFTTVDGTQRAWVESMAAIPTASGDEVWMVVKRTIGGATVRRVERLNDGVTLDSCVADSGTSRTEITGLDHLEGETVYAVTDRYYAGTFTVNAGKIILTKAATEWAVGLRYRPRLKLLPPEIQTGMGVATGNAMRTSEVTVRFYKTTGCSVNGNPLAFRRTGTQALDRAPEQFTGIKRVENLGFERGASDLEFTQEEPMLFHILSVTRKFTVNEG